MTERTQRSERTDRAEESGREAMALRGEFVRAFVEHVGPRPASDRMTVRLPTLLTVAALTAVGALVVGVFTNLLHPAKTGAQVSASQAAQPRITFSQVAGWDCPGGTDHGFEAHGRTPDWVTVPSGGWGDQGCHGSFETIPMTGKADTDDAAQNAQWWFAPPAASQCAVSVYVPVGAAPDAAAGAAHYAVLAGRGGAVYAEFVVDQAGHRGQWVAAGAFPVKDSKEIAIVVTDRGVPKKAGDRIAVAQLRVDCA